MKPSTIPILLTTLTLSACATHWENVNPAWNPPGGFARAQQICEYEALRIGGFDHIQQIINQGEARKACMAQFGFQQFRN